MKLLRRLPDIIAAFVLLQTLFFKFTGAPESVYIFQTLGVEPFGRYAAGLAELITAALLLIPRIAWIGALSALGIMGGAILSHILVLGLEVMGDGGLLFGLAILVSIMAIIVLYRDRLQMQAFMDRLLKRP